MAHNLTILQIVALVIACVCGFTDFKTTKIPNAITFPATVLGWAMQFYFFGFSGLLDGFAGAVLGVAITIIPKFKKSSEENIAMGDAKLMMAMGAFLGWVGILLVWFWFSLVWGLVALYRFVSVLPLKTLFGSLMSKTAGGTLFTPETTAKIQKTMRTKIPVAPAAAAGVLLAELLGPGTLEFMGFPDALPRSAQQPGAVAPVKKTNNDAPDATSKTSSPTVETKPGDAATATADSAPASDEAKPQ